VKHIRIHLETTHTEKKASIPIDTSYWGEMWDTYTTDFASVEIHCWKEEVDQIHELSNISAQSNDQGLVKSFTISLNNDNRTYLRNHSVDSNGGLKWFTLYFYKKDVQMLEIAMYGSEIVLYGVDNKEGDQFQELFSRIKHAEYFKEHLRTF